jgi:hypothetical protein
MIRFKGPTRMSRRLFPVRLWSRRRESNPRPITYEAIALPLSYSGAAKSLYLAYKAEQNRFHD